MRLISKATTSLSLSLSPLPLPKLCFLQIDFFLSLYFEEGKSHLH